MRHDSGRRAPKYERMDKWAELRTAYAVARLGTLSAAAESLGVHRATVARHIEALEADLGARIFHRAARGYTPTEVGHELLTVAQRADALIADFAGRTRGRAAEGSGEIVVTALPEIACMLTPAFVAVRAAHPNAMISMIADARVLRLEHGEAHVAVRAGARPDEPDYVVSRLPGLRFALYASQEYLARRGVPDEGVDVDWSDHDFITPHPVMARAPFMKWLAQNVLEERIVLRTTALASARSAVRAGLGLSFLDEHSAAAEPDLVLVRAPRSAWTAPLWLLSHVDLHRTKLVQAMLRAIKGAMAAD